MGHGEVRGEQEGCKLSSTPSTFRVAKCLVLNQIVWYYGFLSVENIERIQTCLYIFCHYVSHPHRCIFKIAI